MDFHAVSIFTPPGTNAYAVVGSRIACEVQVDAKTGKLVSVNERRKGPELTTLVLAQSRVGQSKDRARSLILAGLPVDVTASQQAPFIVDLTMRMKKNGKHPRTKKSKPERIFCSTGACARVLDP